MVILQCKHQHAVDFPTLQDLLCATVATINNLTIFFRNFSFIIKYQHLSIYAFLMKLGYNFFMLYNYSFLASM